VSFALCVLLGSTYPSLFDFLVAAPFSLNFFSVPQSLRFLFVSFSFRTSVSTGVDGCGHALFCPRNISVVPGFLGTSVSERIFFCSCVLPSWPCPPPSMATVQKYFVPDYFPVSPNWGWNRCSIQPVECPQSPNLLEGSFPDPWAYTLPVLPCLVPKPHLFISGSVSRLFRLCFFWVCLVLYRKAGFLGGFFGQSCPPNSQEQYPTAPLTFPYFLSACLVLGGPFPPGFQFSCPPGIPSPAVKKSLLLFPSQTSPAWPLHGHPEAVFPRVPLVGNFTQSTSYHFITLTICCFQFFFAFRRLAASYSFSSQNTGLPPGCPFCPPFSPPWLTATLSSRTPAQTLLPPFFFPVYQPILTSRTSPQSLLPSHQLLTFTSRTRRHFPYAWARGQEPSVSPSSSPECPFLMFWPPVTNTALPNSAPFVHFFPIPYTDQLSRCLLWTVTFSFGTPSLFFLSSYDFFFFFPKGVYRDFLFLPPRQTGFHPSVLPCFFLDFVTT